MTTQTHNVDLSKPVLKEALERDRLIQLFRNTVDKWYPITSREQSKNDPDRGKHTDRTKAIRQAQVRYHAISASVDKFEKFLIDKNISTLTIDEQLIRDFQAELSTLSKSRFDIEKPCQHIRNLINALPNNMRQRELASMAEYKRIHRWDDFSEDTPKILDDFRKNGRRLKAKTTRKEPVLSTKLLSEPYREQAVGMAYSFLKAVGAKDILKVTPDDVEDFIDAYAEDDNARTAIAMLNYIRPIFTTLLAKGLIKSDPLIDLPKQETRENLDYVPQKGINKLADLSTVNMNDFMDVRGRLLAFTMDYDFALRNRESSLVKVTDLKLNEKTVLSLPKSIQKIKRENVLLYSYFPEVSRPLLDTYLKLRAAKNPATDILIVADDGMPLKITGCRKAVKDHCIKLGIKTEAGKIPTPHRLRHSFGTLNIKPLGRLELQQVCRQYRHRNIETTYRLYIAKNPILQLEEYEATMRDNGNGNGGLNGGHKSPALIPQAPSFQQGQDFT
jgi:site-specific recombinase XerC